MTPQTQTNLNRVLELNTIRVSLTEQIRILTNPSSGIVTSERLIKSFPEINITLRRQAISLYEEEVKKIDIELESLLSI